MMLHTRLDFRFVHHIPERLEPGVLYVSLDYGTAVHSCCCGCGEEVVTPFSPRGWKMTFDGETISLWPSVGNWNIACRSHYVIKQSRVIEAGPWIDNETTTDPLKKKATKAKFKRTAKDSEIERDEPAQAPPRPEAPGLWSRFKGWAARKK